MDRPARTQLRQKVRRYGFVPRLVLFNNTIFFFLWFGCLGRLLLLLPLVGRKFLPGAIAEFFQYVYTLSLISQVLLSTFPIIRVSKNVYYLKWLKLVNGALITWAIIYHYPKVSRHTAYSVLIFCVSGQEVTNYLYYLFPSPLVRFAKKRLFLVLLPAQKVAEMTLILVSFKFNKHFDFEREDDYEYLFGLFMKSVLLLYIPASYIIFRYLWRTRN